MHETILTIIWLILGIISSLAFAKSLEIASATKANDDEGGRSLELGWIGRAVIIAIVSLVLIAVIALSHFMAVSVIIGLVLSVCLILFSAILRSNGIHVLLSSFLYWGCIFGTSLTYANYRANHALGVTYTILQIICLGLLVLFASIPNLVSNIKEYIEENRDADELEDEKARALSRDDEKDGEIDDELMEYEMEQRKKFYDRLICVVTAILIIIVILVLAWLEAKYNILPPYGD